MPTSVYLLHNSTGTGNSLAKRDLCENPNIIIEEPRRFHRIKVNISHFQHVTILI